MNDHNDEPEILLNHGDAASLMIAAADDRDAMARTIRSLTYAEAATLLLSAIEVGGTLVRLGDNAAAEDRSTSPRELLAAVLESCRDV